MSMGRGTGGSQKCQAIRTLSTIYRGSEGERRNAIRNAPPTVLEPEGKRRNVKNESLQGEGFNIQTQVMSTKCQSFPNNLQGAKRTSQKCHHVHAPASFIWCRDYLAEMPLLTRTKGRVQHPDACYVNHMSILPEQFTGGHG